MRKLFLFCLLFSFCCGALQASEEEKTTPPSSELSTIHTYGGGKFFKTIFDAVHILVFDGSKEGFGKSYSGLLAIALILGTFSAYILALSQESLRPAVKRWLPSFVIIFSIFSLRTNVWIVDHLVAKSGSPHESVIYKVDNVPFVLAKSASLLSWLSYRVTNELERAVHGIKDNLYDWTGHIFAGETLFRSGQVQISDANLDQNFKNFCHDCIANDLLLTDPPYTRQELFEADDLLDFLSKKTNPWLSFSYINDEGKESLVRCHTGIEKIKEKIQGVGTQKNIPFLSSFMKGKNTAAKAAIYGNIGSPQGLLLKNSQTALQNQKKFLEQHYLIDSINKHTNPPDFANFRARQIERANQQTLGSRAVQYIIYTRIVLEGLAYILFPIIVIFALASVGFKAIMHWFQLLVWISLWPPFFVLVKFLLQTIWEMRLESTFGTKTISFNMFSSYGLADLYASMEGAAAGMLATIGILTFFIMKGGGHMMASLAGSLTSPAQSAAAQAAGEAVSGNYSFGNINYGNRSFSKMSGIQWDNNSSLKQGRTSYANGFNEISSDDAGAVLLNKGISSTGTDLKVDQSMGMRLQEGLSRAKSAVEGKENTLSTAQTDTISSAKNFVTALEHNKGWMQNLTGAEQQQASKAWEQVQNYGKNYKETDGTTKQLGASAGFDLGNTLLSRFSGVEGGVHASINRSWNNEYGENAEASERALESIQKLSQFVSNASMSDNFSELQKSAEEFNHNMSNVTNLTEQYRSAVTEQQVAQNAADNWKSMSASGSINLNNEYVDYLMDKNGNDMGLVRNIMGDPMKNKEQMEQFLDFYEKKIQDQYRDGRNNLEKEHEENVKNIPDSLKDFSDPKYDSTQNRINSVNSSLGNDGENVLSTSAQGGGNLQEKFKNKKTEAENAVREAQATAQGTFDPEQSKANNVNKMISNRNMDPDGSKKQAATKEKKDTNIVDEVHQNLSQYVNDPKIIEAYKKEMEKRSKI